MIRLFETSCEEYRQKVLVALRSEFPDLSDYWEEMAQEAMERTLRVWMEGRNKAGRSPLPYMKRVARNLAIDSYRSPERPLDDCDLLPLVDERVVRGHEVHTPIDPATEIVLPAVGRMKRTKRRTVAEAQIQGMEDESIAVDLKLPREQVRSLSSKAAREMRAMDEVQLHIRPAHQRKSRRGEEDAGD
ncbi:hypothetical protein NRK68_36410 (plasmid) [Streptomyces yangpuensis]|uniref:Sigma-70 family RNA polymerase sigma factor n=1 Tax=Streptomyces yangpuensis TaxID=1648182 RepID=A0ABY5Q926_9ACTN|nr:sigma factor [Streptomyces yangpuensis]UUY52740.1 hypothetical protein NRK68_36410 [Streptomyces yangpuensis]